MSETVEVNGKRVLPDCHPNNQRKLTGHDWCPGWDNCECECHEERGREVFEPLPVEGESKP